MQENTYIQLPAKAWHKLAKLLLKICTPRMFYNLHVLYDFFCICNLTYKRYFGPSRVATEGSWQSFGGWHLLHEAYGIWDILVIFWQLKNACWKVWMEIANVQQLVKVTPKYQRKNPSRDNFAEIGNWSGKIVFVRHSILILKSLKTDSAFCSKPCRNTS